MFIYKPTDECAAYMSKGTRLSDTVLLFSSSSVSPCTFSYSYYYNHHHHDATLLQASWGSLRGGSGRKAASLYGGRKREGKECLLYKGREVVLRGRAAAGKRRVSGICSRVGAVGGENAEGVPRGGVEYSVVGASVQHASRPRARTVKILGLAGGAGGKETFLGTNQRGHATVTVGASAAARSGAPAAT